MKPTKNKVFCKDCERTKMLFDTEKKAENFIKFNKAEIEEESGFAPQRCYYCIFCGGWHLTSIKDKIGSSKKEQLLEKYLSEKKATKIKNQPKSSKIENQKKRNKIINELESKIKEMDTSQKELFFAENINTLNKEIEQLLNSNSITEKEKLKDLRQRLEINNIVRKQNGFQKSAKVNKKIEEAREKEMEEWKLWFEKNGKNR